jgi:hypothetical protein
VRRVFLGEGGVVVCPICAAEEVDGTTLQPIDVVDLEDMFPAGVWCGRCGLALVAPIFDEEVEADRFESYDDEVNYDDKGEV